MKPYIPFSESTLAKKFPKAFDALPEAYQADSCLEFWLTSTQRLLYCSPRPSQRSVLGQWMCLFDGEQWVDSKTGQPIER